MDESRSKRTQGPFKGANASSQNIKAYQALGRSPPPESVAPGDRTGPPTITADAPRGTMKRPCGAARWGFGSWRAFGLISFCVKPIQLLGRSRSRQCREYSIEASDINTRLFSHAGRSD